MTLLEQKGCTIYLSSGNQAAWKTGAVSGFLAVTVGPSYADDDCDLRSKLKEEHGLDVRYVQLDIADISAKETVEKATGRLDRRPIPSSHLWFIWH